MLYGQHCEESALNVLIVHAHPEPQSFTTSMMQTARSQLEAAGHSVTVSDLYAMGFNPVASSADFGSRKNPDYLTYALEQRHGVESGTIAPDIAAEVDKLKAADLLILSFPVYWFSVPAIMKGWIDRVLVSGVCYGGKRVYNHGGLKGKTALVACTLGGRDYMFGPQAIHGELEVMLRPLLRGTLAYCGMEVVQPFYGFHIPYLKVDAREAIMADFQQHLAQLDQLPRLQFPVLEDFDDSFHPKQA